MKLDINFSGVLANLVVTGLVYFGDKEKVKDWLKQYHSYFGLPLPLLPDSVKWKVAHPGKNNFLINSWYKIAGKRSEKIPPYSFNKTNHSDLCKKRHLPLL